MQKIIKWGILGAGKIANKFASDLNKTPNCVLKAVASTSLQRAQEFALNHGAKFAFGKYEDLFDIELDVVYIATPHSFHFAHTMLCLNNKVGVLCEKPFAMDQIQTQTMVNLASKNKVFLMEALWSRFMPSFIKLQEIVNSGIIGSINAITADFSIIAPFHPDARLYNAALGGGALLDLGIYPAFLSYLLLGYPTEIFATSIFGTTNVDETTCLIYKYKDAVSMLKCSIVAQSDCMAQIVGTQGRILLHPRFHETKKITVMVGDKKETFDFERDTIGYNFEIEEVNRCLQNNLTESPMWTLQNTLDLMRLLDESRSVANIKYE